MKRLARGRRGTVPKWMTLLVRSDGTTNALGPHVKHTIQQHSSSTPVFIQHTKFRVQYPLRVHTFPTYPTGPSNSVKGLSSSMPNDQHYDCLGHVCYRNTQSRRAPLNYVRQERSYACGRIGGGGGGGNLEVPLGVSIHTYEHAHSTPETLDVYLS